MFNYCYFVVNRVTFVRIAQSIGVSVLIATFLTAPHAQEKLTPEQLVDKHLSSVGSTEGRGNFRSVTVFGVSKAVFKGRGTGMTQGNVVLASDGKKNLLAMKFENPEYPLEMVAFDGSEVSVSSLRPGTRSVLGDFLRVNQATFKSGILGGVLSTAWELYKYDSKNGKLNCSGTKSLGEAKVYECKYVPRGGSDLNITLYFDSETFRHVRTEYSRVITSRQGGNVDSSARQSETRYKMVEDFSGFGVENKLDLPHSYKLFLEILTGNGTTSYEWMMNLQSFTFNERMDPAAFRVGPN